jgi:hypothetical protein
MALAFKPLIMKYMAIIKAMPSDWFLFLAVC